MKCKKCKKKIDELVWPKVFRLYCHKCSVEMANLDELKTLSDNIRTISKQDNCVFVEFDWSKKMKYLVILSLLMVGCSSAQTYVSPTDQRRDRVANCFERLMRVEVSEKGAERFCVRVYGGKRMR